MTQNERLDYLVEAFKADSGEYRNLRTPKDTEGKRRILRSLMNIRMPGEMDESVVEIQDDYLQERIRENGIVELSDIPAINKQQPVDLARRHHEAESRRHCQRREFSDAGMFCPDAYLY